MVERIDLKLTNADFSEIGCPIAVNLNTSIKLSKANKDDIKSYKSSFEYISGGDVFTDADNSITRTMLQSYSTAQILEMSIRLERDYTSKTFKFMGMEVDENYNAVITTPTGRFIVGSLSDKRQIVKFIVENSEADKPHKEMAINLFNRFPDEITKRFITAMKTGALMSVVNSKMGDPSNSISGTNVKSLMDVFSNISTDEVEKSAYSSIILSLVHKAKEDRAAVVTATSSQEYDLNGIIAGGMVGYWSHISDEYNKLYSYLCAMDLWSEISKNVLGDAEFQKRMKASISVSDNNGTALDEAVSFSGISKNGGMVDDNVIRSTCSKNMKKLAKVLSGEKSNESLDMCDIMLGNIDDSGIDNPFFLTEAEMQALSIIDSLNYIDDDASLIKDTYDMSDEDERAEYIKSVIKSYNRNFTEFKPRDSRDVVDGIANTVEDTSGDMSGMVDGNGNPIYVSDVVTSSTDELKVEEFRNNLLKILKLLDKSLKGLKKGF